MSSIEASTTRNYAVSSQDVVSNRYSVILPRESSLISQIYDFVIGLIEQIITLFTSCCSTTETSQSPQQTTPNQPAQPTNTQQPQGTANETIEGQQEMPLDENQERGIDENEIANLHPYTFSGSTNHQTIHNELGKLLIIPGKEYSNTWEMGLASLITHARSKNPFVETTAFKKQEGAVQTLTFFFKGEKFDGVPMLQYLSYGSVLTQNWGLSSYSYCEEKQQNIYRFTVDIAKVFTQDPIGLSDEVLFSDHAFTFRELRNYEKEQIAEIVRLPGQVLPSITTEAALTGLFWVIKGVGNDNEVLALKKVEGNTRTITLISKGEQENALYRFSEPHANLLQRDGWGRVIYSYCAEKQQNIYRISHTTDLD